MRLTLRTLLAYLDDQLESQVADHFQQRLDSNQAARGIADRILTTRSRQIVNAPGLNGFDPNRVAEYLDNVMPVELVADFEVLCLTSSDQLFDEVSACHRIVVQAITEEAQVTDALRRRVGHLQRMATSDNDLQDLEPSDPESADDFDNADTVDDFGDTLDSLREELRDDRSANAGEGSSRQVSQPMTQPQPAQNTMAGARTAGPGLDKRTRSIVTHGAAFAAGIAITLTAAWLAFRQPPDSRENVSANPPNHQGGVVAAPAIRQVNPEFLTDVRASGATASAEFPLVIPETERREQIASEPRNDRGEQAESSSSLDPHNRPTSAPGGHDVADAARQPVAPPPTTISVGATAEPYSGLLVLRQGAWQSVAPGQILSGGDALLALPGFRPRIDLDTHVQIELVGPCSIVPLAARSAKQALVRWHFGRGVLSIERGTRSVGLEFDGLEIPVTLSGRDATLAVEAYRYRPPGLEPASKHRQRTLRFVAMNQPAQWTPPGQTARESMRADEFRIVVDAQPRHSGSGRPPSWVAAEPKENWAAVHLAEVLGDGTAAHDALVEIADEHLPGYVLAAQGLAYLGSFDQAVDALNDPRAHQHWPAVVDALRGAMAQNPQLAPRVLESCQRLGPDFGHLADRLLQGYSHDSLRAGEADRLVKFLDSESLAIRVLAFENLRRITGRTLLYRPHVAASQRRSKTEAWGDWAASGAVVYPKRPTPLDVLESL